MNCWLLIQSKLPALSGFTVYKESNKDDHLPEREREIPTFKPNAQRVHWNKWGGGLHHRDRHVETKLKCSHSSYSNIWICKDWEHGFPSSSNHLIAGSCISCTSFPVGTDPVIQGLNDDGRLQWKWSQIDAGPGRFMRATPPMKHLSQGMRAMMLFLDNIPSCRSDATLTHFCFIVSFSLPWNIRCAVPRRRASAWIIPLEKAQTPRLGSEAFFAPFSLFFIIFHFSWYNEVVSCCIFQDQL